MELYPIYLNLIDKKCLIVGGGKVAERKARSLIECGADVQLVSPDLTKYLQKMVEQGAITYRCGFYRVSDLEQVYLVIGAADDEQLNQVIAADCSQRKVPVNIVDDPQKCSFFVPSVVRRGSFKIAVSTGGNSPKLAKITRLNLEEEFGSAFSEFNCFLGSVRAFIQAQVSDPEQRKQILSDLVDETTYALVKQGDLEQAKERVKNVCFLHRCQP